MSVTNIAAYKFAGLSDLEKLRDDLKQFCSEHHLKGTILLSPEGINLFVAGNAADTEALLTRLRTIPGLADIEAKYSPSGEQPFNRMLVRIKKEIIAFGVPGIDPAADPAPKLPASTLKQWLDEGRKITLLDTRNDYEIKQGTFAGALPAGIDHFRDFPDAVRRLPQSLKDEPIVMFCTGGIRCEKAGPFMQKEGFRHIYQLEGGILKYFEECGGAHYDGECFVFDRRVGVGPDLDETPSVQCFNCQSPLTEAEQQDPRYVPSRTCPHCYDAEQERLAERLRVRQEAFREITATLPGAKPYSLRHPLIVPEKHRPTTVLAFLSELGDDDSKNNWEQRLSSGEILDSNGHPLKGEDPIKAGARLFALERHAAEGNVRTDVTFLYEDDALIVLGKPPELPERATADHRRNCLEYILNRIFRPHKPKPLFSAAIGDSGLLVYGKTSRTVNRLQTDLQRDGVEISANVVFAEPGEIEDSRRDAADPISQEIVIRPDSPETDESRELLQILSAWRPCENDPKRCLSGQAIASIHITQIRFQHPDGGWLIFDSAKPEVGPNAGMAIPQDS